MWESHFSIDSACLYVVFRGQRSVAVRVECVWAESLSLWRGRWDHHPRQQQYSILSRKREERDREGERKREWNKERMRWREIFDSQQYDKGTNWPHFLHIYFFSRLLEKKTSNPLGLVVSSFFFVFVCPALYRHAGSTSSRSIRSAST